MKMAVALGFLVALHLERYASALVQWDRGAHPVQPVGKVHFDEEPLVLDFSEYSNLTSMRQALHFMRQRESPSDNPKNGTPWFRYTKASSAGVAGHDHFNGLMSSGVFQFDMVTAHNVVRNRAGMYGVSWNSELAALAERRVRVLTEQGCYIQHSPTDYRWEVAGFQYVGENLYKVINMKPTGVDIVDAWYEELEDYTYGTMGASCTKEVCAGRSSPPCTLGHFTQVMWERTTDIGCALAECPGKEKSTSIAVCHYGPGGNIVGEMPFSGNAAYHMGLSSHDCTKPQRYASMLRNGAPGLQALAPATFLAILSLCAYGSSSFF